MEDKKDDFISGSGCAWMVIVFMLCVTAITLALILH